ncbi:MAG: thiamine phosphate synthase [Planctomycetota bacterium]
MGASGTRIEDELAQKLRIVAITAGRTRTESASFVVERCRLLVDAGVSGVLLREPERDARELLAIASDLHDEVTLPAGALLLVSDRVDIALAVGADGVHLGFRSLHPADARRVARDRLAIGFSLHDPIHEHLAAIRSSHYVTFGPVFDTPSKHGLLQPTGVARLKEVCDSLECPVVAVGGIDAERSALLRGSGVAGLAMIRALWDAPEPSAVVRAMRAALE